MYAISFEVYRFFFTTINWTTAWNEDPHTNWLTSCLYATWVVLPQVWVGISHKQMLTRLMVFFCMQQVAVNRQSMFPLWRSQLTGRLSSECIPVNLFTTSLTHSKMGDGTHWQHIWAREVLLFCCHGVTTKLVAGWSDNKWKLVQIRNS